MDIAAIHGVCYTMFLSPKNRRDILLLAFAHILAFFLQMSDCSLTQTSVFICVTSVRLERSLWTECWRNRNPITALKGKPLIKQNLSWPWALVFYRFPQNLQEEWRYSNKSFASYFRSVPAPCKQTKFWQVSGLKCFQKMGNSRKHLEMNQMAQICVAYSNHWLGMRLSQYNASDFKSARAASFWESSRNLLSLQFCCAQSSLLVQ